MRLSKVVRDIGGEYGAIFVVAVSVTLAGALGAAFLKHVHQVDADAPLVPETAAVVGPDGAQTLMIKEWGVRFVAPLGEAMPTLVYSAQSDSSMGLSTADLEQAGPQCRASHNGLGALTRMPAGTFVDYAKGSTGVRFVATLGRYDYGYAFRDSACSTLETAQIINRERSVLTEALGTLAPIGE